MLLLLILPLLISGYYVQQWNYKHYYQLHKYTGQLLYLKSAALGAICLGFSFIIISCIHLLQSIKILNFDLLGFLTYFLTNNLNINRSSLPFIILLTFFSFVVAAIWSFGENLINVFYRVVNFDKAQFKGKEGVLPTFSDKWNICKFGYILDLKDELFSENPLDDLLMKSYRNHEDIMLYMKDRKVYVGFVAILSEPNESDSLGQKIAIFPLKSGYQDKDNLTVTITTEYKAEHVFYIILRREEIVSATRYIE